MAFLRFLMLPDAGEFGAVREYEGCPHQAGVFGEHGRHREVEHAGCAIRSDVFERHAASAAGKPSKPARISRRVN